MYKCRLCGYTCGQKSHIDSHKRTAGHLDKYKDMTARLKTEKELYYKYIQELKIVEDDEKTLFMLRQEIVDRLSTTIYMSKNAQHAKEEEEEEQIREIPKIVIRKNGPDFSLIHELTQFTKGKTEQVLNIITERFLNIITENYLFNSISSEAHIIQIIITNKSLGETKQWKVRTKIKMDQYENIDVDILSSDVNSEYHSIDKFITKIMMAKSKNELPNILIICFHKKRIEDILRLFQMFSGKTVMIQNAKLKFNLSIDEPDANLGLCSMFLKYKDHMNQIDNIEFITATPYEKFWNMLHDNGIFKLTNPNNDGQDCTDGKEYDEYLDNYRQIKQHTHLVCNHRTSNPLEYIEYVFSSSYPDEQLDEQPYIDMMDATRKIIFSPAHLFTVKEGVGSHNEVVQFYTSLDFTVYLSNGKFKGFIEPNGERMSLEDFNTQYNIRGELRDTLRLWARIYPAKNLAITGYWTIERGITFQTDGFNFTHMIISDYHAQMLNKLIQLVGRGTGDKKYITDVCKIICPQHIIDTVDEMVEKTAELKRLNPENYNFTDFSDKNSSIPVKVTFLDEEWRQRVVESITKKRGYKDNLHALLKEGYQTGKIQIEDRNNVHVFTNDKKDTTGRTKIFDDIHKSITNVKMYSSDDKSPESRRFAQFNAAFNTYKPTSQTGEAGEYSIDLAKDRYEHKGFINEVNIAWITFRY
jgi:hypothetical protein